MGNSIYWGKYRGRLEEELARYTPSTWQIDVENVNQPDMDARVNIRASDGAQTTVAVEFKTELNAATATRAWDLLRTSGYPGLLMAPRISARTQEYLREQEIYYADFSGNAYWALASPALFVHVISKNKASKAEERVRRFSGAKAGRLIRYLCDNSPPFTLGSLAESISSDIGNVSRYVNLLASDGLVTKRSRGVISDVDWQGVLRRWSADYRRPIQERYFDPRGQDHFTATLRKTKQRYALSGVSAAAYYAPYTTDSITFCYCDDLHQFARTQDLRQAERSANVVLALPFDESIYDHMQTRSNIALMAPTQVVVDLLTGRGRELQQAEELLRWMRVSEHEWKS